MTPPEHESDSDNGQRRRSPFVRAVLFAVVVALTALAFYINNLRLIDYFESR